MEHLKTAVAKVIWEQKKKHLEILNWLNVIATVIHFAKLILRESLGHVK